MPFNGQLFLDNLQAVFTLVFRNPDPIELWIMLGLSFLACVFLLIKIGSAFEFQRMGNILPRLTAAIGFVLPFVAMALVLMFFPATGGWVLGGAAAAVMLVVVLPLTCWWLKGTYLSALMAWAISLAAAVAIVLAVHAVFSAVTAGRRDAQKSFDHKRDLNEFMNKQR
ncbi:MAG: hypothetical protein HY343_10795 [Lentisphaerae bacterium]|nr:hypothetical protein [Lentisphaerota bacterium]